MEIDHVFVFVEPKGADLAYLHALGLVETYRRTHAGQGTQNICFCFDNMFLECLWVSDVGEVQSDLVARTRLYERSQWRSAGTSPFGIAWRMTGNEAAFAPAMWAFRPPYLPPGLSIDISVDSDDPQQPMMLKSPDTTAPLQWAADRRRGLQQSAGLGRITAIRLELPRAITPSPTLAAVADHTMLQILPVPGTESFLTCEVERPSHPQPLVIRLPV